MAIRRNSYYFDPGLASAFDNLASAFATPSGSDTLGYVRGAAEREKAARLAELFANPTDPNFDRKNIAVGNYAPVQSFYAQDQNNATTRRGQDVSAGAQRDVARINSDGALSRLYATPITVSDGQTVVLPQQTQAATGLPQSLGGNVTVNQGQRAVRPDGSVVEGAPKPPTDSEVKAAIIGGLRPNEQRAIVMQGVGTTNVVGADEKPVVTFTPDAVGKTPYERDTLPAQTANFKTPDGRTGTAAYDRDTGKWKETQTGAELPPGTQTYSANLQGDKQSTGLGASTQNNVDGMLVDLALAQDTSKQLRSIIVTNPGSQGLVGSIRGTVQDVIAAGGEVGKLLDANMKSIKADIAAGNVPPEIVAKFANFDPSIPATNMLETLLTAQVAKVLDPNGRISNDRYQQVARALGNGGLTGNAQRTLATLDALDTVIERRRNILAPSSPTAARIGQGAPAPTAAPPAAASGAPQRLRFNPATGQIE
ncbi:hypothetical protein [Rhodopseudomonas pseudopalustris]|uniref:Uncharacterized protein n=1 Tax=Rhodopseudomonas pseudopalustris TaxID=1513892 RepID=A0A1H8WJ37_9BRAD|nr:hypothetical protein [Rhodopseudomonas pseudopalustris]SEP27533.1 hypothetical protein SAMN05444123_112132 [Rhodopseudomonas pseudopalustris]